MPFKIVFAGTPDFAAIALKALLKSDHDVLAVYTQPDRPAGRGREIQFSPVKKIAMEHHLPIHQPLKLKDPQEQDILRALAPDLLIVAAYGLILPKAVLDIPKYGCINIHASLLPRWRGAAPIQHAILAADQKSGITIMQMDAGLDTGDILGLYPCDLDERETAASLHDKLALIGADAIVEVLKKLETKTLSPVKQDANFATYANKIMKDDGKINWHESAEKLDCKIRAFNPWPIAFTQLQDQIIRIWAAEPITNMSYPTYPTYPLEISNAIPGTILAVDKESILVAAGDGILRLLEIQLPGGKKLPVSEILKSKSQLFKIGTAFI